jgi:competence protein ComGC
MGIEGWRRKAQDRDQWRRIAQETKAHVGLLMMMMMMMIIIIIIFLTYIIDLPKLATIGTKIFIYTDDTSIIVINSNLEKFKTQIDKTYWDINN